MTSMYDCLQSAIDDGLIDADRATKAQQDVLDHEARYLAAGYPQAAAQALAAQDVKTAARKAARARRHAVLAKLHADRRNVRLVETSPDYARMPKAVIGAVQDAPHGVETVEGVRQALRQRFIGEMHEVLRATGKDLFGRTRNKILLRDVVRELHGEASGNAAAAGMAAGVKRMQRSARAMFNAWGGDIGELADYGLTHTHERRAIEAAGFDAWANETAPRLDWSRIEDKATGQPFAAQSGGRPDPAAARRFLRDVYDNIVTDGWANRTPSSQARGAALYNRRAEARVLHFRSADDWLAYNEKYGAADPFESIVRHADGMARDIALMRVLGPNPTASLELMIQTAMKRAATDPKARAEVQKQAAIARAMLRTVTGAANTPADESLANFLAGTRALLTAAQLGGAVLSAASDPLFGRMAARAVGMNPNNLTGRAVKLIASQATRDTAAAMGFVADTVADAGSASARYLGEVWTPELAQRISNGVLRASGLSAWTDIMRLSWRMEFAHFLADNADRAFADLPAPLRRLFERKGFRPDEWDRLRDPALAFTAANGSRFIAPTHWTEAAVQAGLSRAEADGIGARIGAIIEEELEFAVPNVSLEGRSRLLGDQAPGTFAGELLRSGLMYKNFAVSVTMAQYRRVMAMPSGWTRASYLARFVAGLTLAGAISMQLKELAKGRDPQRMDEAQFWSRALFQGGGLGIFGDLLVAESTRAGGGLAETLGGPVVGLGGDLTRAVSSNVARVAEGRDPLIGRDVVNLARRYNPAASLWYTRTALDRLVWDQLQDALDPEAREDWGLYERRLRKFGTRSWWERGAVAPERAPNLAQALGETP